MPRIALLQGTNAMRRCPMVLASVSSVRSASAARVATPRKSGQQMRPPLTKGVNPGYSYDPASLCSEGASHAVDWMATFPWTGWQKSSGLDGNIPVDYVATFPWTGWQKSVEYASATVGVKSRALRSAAWAWNRDRGRPHGLAPPTPPYIRVTYTAVRWLQSSTTSRAMKAWDTYLIEIAPW
jgi:hypothetical protein